MSFRWQTDEETNEPVAQRQTPPADRRLLRRALSILAILALTALAAALAWRTVEQRAAAAEDRVKADVLSIHNLARRAARDGDDELYLTLLSPQFDAWTDTQQQLMQEDLLFAGAPRVYNLVPLPGADPTPQITLDPTFTRATVLSQQSFALTTTARLTESMTLRQAHTYNLGDSGWRLAPPDGAPPGDFWSSTVRLRSDMLTLEYPRRDEAFALRLVRELERLLPQTCALPGLRCPPDLHLDVRLSTDPAAILRVTAPEAMLQGGVELELPAPSLLGQPLDEPGLRHVSRVYAAHVVAPLISHLAGYDCCARGLLTRAILQRQLHHLGLRPWPLSPDHYEALMEQGLTLRNALVLQSRSAALPRPQTWRQMLSLVEFLEASLPPGALLSHMDASLDVWLLGAGDPGQLVVQWTEFVYRRSRSAQLAASLDLPPGGAIQLTCYESNAVAVQRYDLRRSTWQHGLTYAPQNGWQVESVFSLPADYGDVIKESRRNEVDERIARYVWRHTGGTSVLFETMPGADGARLFAPYDGRVPHWRYTVLSPDHTSLRASLQQEWWLLDLTVCSDGDCLSHERVARPAWSPDGAQLLLEVQPTAQVWDPGDLTLFHAGNRGQNSREIGHGFAPAWLDDAHYAYLRAVAARSRQDLVVAATDHDRAQVVASNRDFVAILDRNLEDGQRLQLDRLQEIPGVPGRLLVQATLHGPVNRETYLFVVRLDPAMQQLVAIERLFHSDGGLDFRVAPNGRWIAATNLNTWTLIDLRQGQTRPLGGSGALAWSPDGNWFVQSRDNYIMLHAAHVDYKRPIIHELGDCPFSSLQWQSR